MTQTTEAEASWERYKSHFLSDGALRDIYVFGVSNEDWPSVYRALPEWADEVRFFADGESEPLPATFEHAYARAREAAVILRLDIGSLPLVSHLFSRETIEFSVDPSTVEGPEDFFHLVAFMKKLAALTRKDALLCYEDEVDREILRISARQA